MKTNRIFILLVLAAASTGCARGYVGTYNGTETVSVNGTTTASPVTISITVDSGNSVSGTWTGSNGSGTLSGTPNGGSLNNVNLLITAPATSVTIGGVYTTSYAGCPNTFQG